MIISIVYNLSFLIFYIFGFFFDLFAKTLSCQKVYTLSIYICKLFCCCCCLCYYKSNLLFRFTFFIRRFFFTYLLVLFLLYIILYMFIKSLRKHQENDEEIPNGYEYSKVLHTFHELFHFIAFFH